MEDKGISKEEALFLLRKDIVEVKELLSKYEWFISLDEVRQKVIIDMAFNLGINGLLKFRNMIAAIEKCDYAEAAAQMVDSSWYRQVKTRADRLVCMMSTGEDYKN